MTIPFQVSRATLDRLATWIDALGRPHLPAVRDSQSDGSFHWRFREHSAATAQIGKAVRMTSAVRAAMLLADAGYTTEAGSLLRTVGDFHAEILALTEALLEGRLMPGQQKFIDQYFAPRPLTPEALESARKERYVSREELFKSHRKLAEKGAVDADELLRVSRFLNLGFDQYVHGGYLTAMELYRGDKHEFVVTGMPFARSRCVARRAVAGKLHEVLLSLGFIAMVQGRRALFEEIAKGRRALEASGEQGVDCDAIASRAEES